MSETIEAACVQQLMTNMWTALGMIITALFIGGFLTLAIPCVHLLSPKGIRQRRFWQCFIAALILANLGYEAVCFLWNTYRIIYASVNPLNGAKFTRALAICCSIFPVIIVTMTDAVLVWRCYMVQEALGSDSSSFGRVYYIIPLFLWIVTMAVGSVGAALIDNTHLTAMLQTVAVGSNILLNVFATCFIAISLLLHRRKLISFFGEAAPGAKHLRTVNILVESAAINIPVTVVGVIGIAVNPVLGDIVGAIAVACQSFASVLILHRIALGRAVGHRDGTDSLTTRVDPHASEPIDTEC